MSDRTYSAQDVANWFLSRIDREAGDTISNLKLQKLLYYAQAWMLALYDRPLFRERIEAWMHGPVVPEMYRQYREHGWDALPMPQEDVPKFDDDAENLLQEVLRVYGEHSAKALEELTHSEEPWQRTRGSLPLEARCNDEIPHDLMRDFYRRMLDGQVGQA